MNNSKVLTPDDPPNCTGEYFGGVAWGDGAAIGGLGLGIWAFPPIHKNWMTKSKIKVNFIFGTYHFETQINTDAFGWKYGLL